MDSDIRCPSLGETLERYHLSDHVPNTPGTKTGEKTDQGPHLEIAVGIHAGGSSLLSELTQAYFMVSLNHMPSPKTRFGPTHTNVTRGAGGRLRYQVICRDAANNVGRKEGCCDVSHCQTEVTQIHSLGQLGTLDYHIYVLAGSLLFRYYQ